MFRREQTRANTATYDHWAMKTPQFSASGHSRTLGSAALAAMLVLPLATVIWAAGDRTVLKPGWNMF